MRTVLYAAALLLLVPRAGNAQAQPLQPDQRIRIVAPEAGFPHPIAGTVVAVRGDTLLMQVGPRSSATGVQVSLPVSSIVQLERSAGPRNRATYGLFGLALGTGLGAAAGHLHYRMQAVYTDGVTESGRESLRPQLTVAGALIGTVVGVMLPGEQWNRARLGDWITLDTSPSVDGTGLGLRVTF
jgi:hypothetical protein